MSKKIYLVDTENVGFSWSHLLEKISSRDKIILFYTENSPNLSYVDLAYIQNHCEKFTLEKCHAGKDALDFQLVSYMGYHIKSNPKTHFTIVSNDSGYDSVIKYWSDKGYEITRMITRDSEKTPPTNNLSQVNEKNISNNKNGTNTIIKQKLSNSYSAKDIQWIHQMLNKYSLNELQLIHSELRNMYGQSDGTTLYRLIKPLLKDFYN